RLATIFVSTRNLCIRSNGSNLLIDRNRQPHRYVRTVGQLMQLNRRSFMKLIPLGLVAIWSWWFLEQSAREPITTPQVTGVRATASQTASTTEIIPQATSNTEITPQEATSTTSAATPVSSTATAFEFPVTWNGEQPTTIDPNDYTLTIDGDVPKPLEFKLEDLYAMTGVQKTLKIQCVEGWSAEVPWE